MIRQGVGMKMVHVCLSLKECPKSGSCGVFKMARYVFLLGSLLLMSGCLWPVHEQTRMTVNELSIRPFDLLPESAKEL